MCGRMVLSSDGKALAAAFGIRQTLNVGARYNIAPGQDVLALLSLQGRKQFSNLRWGLVPSWAPDTAMGSKLINARAETLAEKPAFKEAYRYRRCAVIADGFYEWQGQGSTKQPYFVRLKSRAPIALAGLYDSWKGPGATQPLKTATVITVAADPGFASIHERMPAILPEKALAAWLNPETDFADLPRLLRPLAAENLVFWAVSARVNDASVDEPALVAPLAA